VEYLALIATPQVEVRGVVPALLGRLMPPLREAAGAPSFAAAGLTWRSYRSPPLDEVARDLGVEVERS